MRTIGTAVEADAVCTAERICAFAGRGASGGGLAEIGLGIIDPRHDHPAAPMSRASAITIGSLPETRTSAGLVGRRVYWALATGCAAGAQPRFRARQTSSQG